MMKLSTRKAMSLTKSRYRDQDLAMLSSDLTQQDLMALLPMGQPSRAKKLNQLPVKLIMLISQTIFPSTDTQPMEIHSKNIKSNTKDPKPAFMDTIREILGDLKEAAPIMRYFHVYSELQRTSKS